MHDSAVVEQLTIPDLGVEVEQAEEEALVIVITVKGRRISAAANGRKSNASELIGLLEATKIALIQQEYVV